MYWARDLNCNKQRIIIVQVQKKIESCYNFISIIQFSPTKKECIRKSSKIIHKSISLNFSKYFALSPLKFHIGKNSSRFPPTSNFIGWYRFHERIVKSWCTRLRTWHVVFSFHARFISPVWRGHRVESRSIQVHMYAIRAAIRASDEADDTLSQIWRGATRLK